MEWQPIATAPKDGTEILVLYGTQGNVKRLAYFSKLYGYWLSKGEPQLGLEENATHWVPLPPPPLKLGTEPALAKKE